MEYHLKSTGFKFKLILLLPTVGPKYKITALAADLPNTNRELSFQ